MQGSANNKQKDRIEKNYGRLGDKAGNAESIELDEYKNTLRERSDNLMREARDEEKKKAKRSGYGVVENPCPQYLQPG